MGVILAVLSVWISSSASLADSAWFMPIYKQHPLSGPSTNLFLVQHSINGLPLRFFHDYSLFSATALGLGIQNEIIIKDSPWEKPISTAYSLQGIDQSLNVFGAFFCLPHKLLADFNRAQHSDQLGQDEFVGHGLVLYGGFDTKLAAFSGTAISRSSNLQNNSSDLFIRAGVDWPWLGLQAFTNTLTQDTLNPHSISSRGLRLAGYAGGFQSFFLWENLSDTSGSWSSLRPGLIWQAGPLRVSASWLRSDSGSGPNAGISLRQNGLAAGLFYTTEIPDPSLVPGHRKPLGSLNASFKLGFGPVDLVGTGSWGKWVIKYSTDSSDFTGIINGVRCATGARIHTRLGPVSASALVSGAYFSSGAPRSLLWRVQPDLSWNVRFRSGDIVLSPGVEGVYIGEPWNVFWWAGHAKLRFYDAVEISGSLDNPLDYQNINIMGANWPGRAWHLKLVVLMWD